MVMRRAANHGGLVLAIQLLLSSAFDPGCAIRRPRDCPVQAVLDGLAAGLRFDGHGAVSARGTSKYLYDYDEPIRAELLDLLFLPGYAGSIQVLKVEIGGDAQSGFGTEPTHQRAPGDVACERVRTFWLMREARLRNPALVVYAVPWTFPGWVGMENGTQTDFYNTDSLDYIVSWIQCANKTGAGAVDYVGNRPRPTSLDLLGRSQSSELPPRPWVLALRAALDDAGLNLTRLVLPDSTYDAKAEMLLAQPDVVSALSGGALGLHYPCFLPLPSLLRRTSLALWSSEDVGIQADWSGAACTGRIVNTNFVRMNATSTLVRSLAWAVHPSLPGVRDGLIEASEPWSGRYEIKDGLWTLAHTTRFTEAGWLVLPPQTGSSGHLMKGGTFVTYLSPGRDDFTVVVEKLQAPCGNCSGAITGAEEIAFTLSGGLEIPWLDKSAPVNHNETEENSTEADENSSSSLHVSDSDNLTTEVEDSSPGLMDSNASNVTEVPLTGLEFWLTNKTHKLLRLPPLPVDPKTGTVNFTAQSDTIYTITSLRLNESVARAPEMKAAPFPVPYQDDFDVYAEEDTPGYFADYGGSFQVSRDPSHPPNLVLKQNVEQQPRTNSWTTDADPITLIGHRMTNVSLSADIYIPGTEPLPRAAQRTRIQAAWGGQCLAFDGVAEKSQVVQKSCQDRMEQSFALDSSGRILIAPNAQSCLTAHLCSDSPYRGEDGEVCVRPCGLGPLGTVEISNQTWAWHQDGSLRLAARPELCLTSEGPAGPRPPLRLRSCSSPELSVTQRWLAVNEEMLVYAGACLRLQPRRPAGSSSTRDADAGDLLYGLTGRNGYCLRLGVDAGMQGTWRLESGGRSAALLASGPLAAPLNTWHRLRIACNGSRIRVKIDDSEEVVSIDSDHSLGAGALLSGWHHAYYDNFALEGVESLEPVFY